MNSFTRWVTPDLRLPISHSTQLDVTNHSSSFLPLVLTNVIT